MERERREAGRRPAVTNRDVRRARCRTGPRHVKLSAIRVWSGGGSARVDERQVMAAVPQKPMGVGSIVSSVSVTSPGASAMRMSIEVELPDGGELRFFDGQSNTGPDGSGYPVIGPIDLVPKNGAPGLLAPSAAEPEVAGAGSALSGLSFSLDRRRRCGRRVKGDTIGVEISLPSADALAGRDVPTGGRATRSIRGGDLPAVRGRAVHVLVTSTCSVRKGGFRRPRQTRWHRSCSTTTKAPSSAPGPC